MCGIVGLHLRDTALYPRLGELLTGMLCEMSERGADSAGVAVYGDPVWSPPGHATVTVLASSVPTIDGATVIDLGEVQVVHAPTPVDDLLARLAGLPIAGFGEELTVLKGVGHPRDLATAFQLERAQGWQGVGHTRMATESAVTPAGAHPYAVGPDQCLVHNGSFANHATIRRHLRARGVVFDSENDTEVGARYVAQALADGRDVESALKSLCAEFDGFYTLLVSNRDSFAVVRDAIACKPAVIAETGAWVAMASEYRALVGLPGIEKARIFEPEPERIYAWTR
jgi:glutamate synthase domain-containing protein 1